MKKPCKSLGWLLGPLFLGLVVGYPPAYGFSLAGTWIFTIAYHGWIENVIEDLRVGGVAWHMLAYQQMQAAGYDHMAYIINVPGIAFHSGTVSVSPTEGFTSLMQILPYCAVALAFPLCSWLLWRKCVDDAERPTMLHGVGTAFLALIASLVLIFLLDRVGGSVMLRLASLDDPTTNYKIQLLIQSIWITAVIQTVLFALPALILGGLLAWCQEKMNGRGHPLGWWAMGGMMITLAAAILVVFLCTQNVSFLLTGSIFLLVNLLVLGSVALRALGLPGLPILKRKVFSEWN